LGIKQTILKKEKVEKTCFENGNLRPLTKTCFENGNLRPLTKMCDLRGPVIAGPCMFTEVFLLQDGWNWL
jgi:hypothetical protein